MSLSPGDSHVFDADRMVMRFTMMNDDVKINCAVSTDAMDHIEGAKRVTLAQREEQFMRLRSKIEARAEQKIIDAEFEGQPAGIILRSIDFRRQL
ncbi:MAG: DUF1488 domain-containing protein [Xanthobacteraceae bacterium]|nr:DUF1488 domain-containing protein [Xanthobacteraceae bacterium]